MCLAVIVCCHFFKLFTKTHLQYPFKNFGWYVFVVCLHVHWLNIVLINKVTWFCCFDTLYSNLHILIQSTLKIYDLIDYDLILILLWFVILIYIEHNSRLPTIINVWFRLFWNLKTHLHLFSIVWAFIVVCGMCQICPWLINYGPFSQRFC